MKMVVDTNIILSALIKDSTTRKIIVKSEWDFYYPEMSFHEIRKYKELVLKKSNLNKEEYRKLLNYLLEHITLVPNEIIYEKLDKAHEIMAHINPDDVIFIATQLSISNSVIWSDDKDFDKQKEIRILKTAQICKLYDSIPR